MSKKETEKKSKAEKVQEQEKEIVKEEVTSETQAAEAAEGEAQEVLQRAEAAEKAAEEHKDRWMRLMADFDNYKKRIAREQAEWGQRANERLLADFLPVFDHLDLALEKVPESERESPFVTGVDMVRSQLAEAFSKHGLKQIDARGGTFDPMLHEALSQIPSETVPEQGIVQQFRCGWMLGDKLLRAAQVIVSSGKSQEA